MSPKLELARRSHDEPTPDEAWMSFETESTSSTAAPPAKTAAPPTASASVAAASAEKPAPGQSSEGTLAAVPNTLDSLDSLTARVRASSAAATSAAAAVVRDVVETPWHQHPLFRPLVALTALAGIVIAATYIAIRVPRTPAVKSAAQGTGAAARPVTGPNAPQSTAIFTSEPSGAAVTVDAVERGVTPLKLSLPVGDHVVDFTYNDVTRSMNFDLAAQTTATQHMEFAADAGTGKLEVSSDPSGQPIRIDGSAKGRTPLSLASIGVGRHTIVVGSGDTTVQRNVNIAAGATASVVVTLPTTGPSAGGWITFSKTAADLQVLEKGEVIGTTSAARLMLPAGKHDLELVSDALEFRASLSVQVKAGATTPATVVLPNGSLSVNASPWADVFVDGKPLGTTPLANIAVPIGTHEIVWRHPQLGERRRTVTLSARTPTRVGMDLTR